jgi:hypothetical protein
MTSPAEQHPLSDEQIGELVDYSLDLRIRAFTQLTLSVASSSTSSIGIIYSLQKLGEGFGLKESAIAVVSATLGAYAVSKIKGATGLLNAARQNDAKFNLPSYYKHHGPNFVPPEDLPPLPPSDI